MPRSDNVVRSTDLRSGLVCSACGLARLAAARGTQQFPSDFQGGAEETKITQAFSSKRHIHNLIRPLKSPPCQSPTFFSRLVGLALHGHN